MSFSIWTCYEKKTGINRLLSTATIGAAASSLSVFMHLQTWRKAAIGSKQLYSRALSCSSVRLLLYILWPASPILSLEFANGSSLSCLTRCSRTPIKSAKLFTGCVVTASDQYDTKKSAFLLLETKHFQKFGNAFQGFYDQNSWAFVNRLI